MCLAQGPQRSDAGEARTRGPSVSSQTFYHWATALPWRTEVPNIMIMRAFKMRGDFAVCKQFRPR